MVQFIYFRCYSFRINLPRGKVSPRRSTTPLRRPITTREIPSITTREIPYYGIVESEARLIESPSSVPDLRADSFIFEPPRLFQPEPVRVQHAVGEVLPIEGRPLPAMVIAEPVPAESSAEVSVPISSEPAPAESSAEVSVPISSEPVPAESSVGVSEILPAEPAPAESSTVLGTPMVQTSLLLKGGQPKNPFPAMDLQGKKPPPIQVVEILVGFQIVGVLVVEVLVEFLVVEVLVGVMVQI